MLYKILTEKIWYLSKLQIEKEAATGHWQVQVLLCLKLKLH